MAIKLITSKTYVDNIRNFLPEKPNSKTSASEKSAKLFEKIINSPNFIFDKSDKKITEYITTLLSIRSGRTLFKRLLKANKPLQIVRDSKNESKFRYISGFDNKGKIISTITLNDSQVDYLISVNSTEDKIFTSTPSFIALAHELIHALHYFEENPDLVSQKTMTKSLIDPDLDDLEEQETIVGKEGEAVLCENVFRFHFGYPLRINHRGLSLDRVENTFTASDCASHGMLGSLKEMLLSNPSLLNLPQLCTYGDNTAMMTPLNAAIWAEAKALCPAPQWEILDYLFEIGVDIHARDEFFGTALHAAAFTNPCWVTELLEAGVDPNVKNPKGFTALELALYKKNDSATRILARKTNLKELDSQGLSILHRALELGSPDGIRALIQNGADINCKDLEGNTPLMRLCSFDYPKDKEEEFKQKFNILLENDHLDLKATNIKGESAFSLERQKKRDWQMSALSDKGAGGMNYYGSDSDDDSN